MTEQKLRGVIREEIKQLSEVRQFPDEFTVDIVLASDYYKKIADAIVDGTRDVVGGIEITREKALRGSYHVKFRGYNRSDLEVRCEVTVMGPVNGKSIVKVSAKEPRGESSGEYSFDVSETPNEAVQSAVKFFKTDFGVR